MLKAERCMITTRETEMCSRSLSEMTDSSKLTRDPETTSHHSRTGLRIKKRQFNTPKVEYWILAAARGGIRSICSGKVTKYGGSTFHLLQSGSRSQGV